MAQSVKAKRINKVNLATPLQEELDGKIERTEVESSFRKSTQLISLDDLLPEVKDKINAWGAPAGSSYSDTELRNRIIAVENGKADKTTTFNKTTDKVGRSLLDATLGPQVDNLNSQAVSHETRISAIEAIVPNKYAVRSNSVLIAETDLTIGLKDKINTALAHAQSSLPTGGSGGAVDASDPEIVGIKTSINNLITSKADKSQLAGYRSGSVSITQADFDSSLQGFISGTNSSLTALAGKADRTELVAGYRNKTVLLDENQLTNELRNKIDAGYDNAVNTSSYVDSAVTAAANTIKSEIITQELGNKYNRDLLPLVKQIEIIDLYGISDDQYTFAHMIGWLAASYRRNADPITQAVLDSALQTKINQIATVQTQANTSTSNVTSLQTDVTDLKTLTSGLNYRGSSYSLQRVITDIASRLAVIESKLTPAVTPPPVV